MFKNWSEYEEKKLIQSIKNKESIPDIAKNHERSVRAIEMRIELLIRKYHQNGMSVTELEKLFNKDQKSIDSILHPKPNIDDLMERVKRIEDIVNKIYKKQKIMEKKCK